MKLTAITTVLASLVGASIAAPALVWKNGSASSPSHSSEVVDISTLVASTVPSSASESSLASVIFVVDRDADGSETLSKLTSSGSLPRVSEKYGDASSVHTHVSGIETIGTVTRDASKSIHSDHSVIKVSLSELGHKLSALGKSSTEEASISPEGFIPKAERATIKRANALSSANVLVVELPVKTPSSDIDSAVSNAIEHSNIDSIILTSVRSVDEVKHERSLLMRQMKNNIPKPSRSNRRRLEDRNWEDMEEEDTDGIYYVNMTPNIFAGILFFLFFAFVANTGIGCLNMITSQDVYTDKYPTIGREA
mmetsp:Transcript_7921/g.11303  ORF Transcript_7921/g.11303 Transcript_7921/m.11303 type:complete len:309 (+) Transcript_7921:83-1009(+)|eukprot:CAMPEP_0184863112 /NCGR_PEP_ID=MMETSP0580-20130426/9086_1 /TAXON_ID=1118495 /ORGANISM="Dactyliosolen fragilissimus" /LENGTH=308 /DNA_ID=CAMNT_0027361217 /DNA_START=20 /DNA_END=946 /DNA_ORIENTATION=-